MLALDLKNNLPEQSSSRTIFCVEDIWSGGYGVDNKDMSREWIRSGYGHVEGSISLSTAYRLLF